MADVKTYNKYIRSPTVYNAVAIKNATDDVKVDYFSKVLQPGDFLSLPDPSIPAICDQLGESLPADPNGIYTAIWALSILSCAFNWFIFQNLFYEKKLCKETTAHTHHTHHANTHNNTITFSSFELAG